MSDIALKVARSPKRSVAGWINKIVFLTVHTGVDRHQSGAATLIFAVVEPLGIIGLLTAINYIMKMPPGFGDSQLLFLSTGIVPFYLVFHIGIRLRTMDRFVHLPHTTKFDEIFARVSAELFLKIMFFAGLSCVLLFIQAHQWYPADPLRCLCALFCICLLGAGLGVINAVICTFIPMWMFAFTIVMRSMLLISAAHNVMDRVPPPFRDWTLWNPLSHIVTYFRSGWYVGYPIQSLDMFFAMKCIAATLFIAFIFERGTRAYRDIL